MGKSSRNRAAATLVVCGLIAVGAYLTTGSTSKAAALEQTQPKAAEDPRFRVQIVAKDLRCVWAMAFLPKDRMIFTERPGRVRVMEKGKICRLNDDETVPSDDAFVVRADARPEIWTLGRRNSQGIDFQYGRIREVAEAPDGRIYFSTSQFDPPEGSPRPDYDQILRLVPAA